MKRTIFTLKMKKIVAVVVLFALMLRLIQEVQAGGEVHEVINVENISTASENISSNQGDSSHIPAQSILARYLLEQPQARFGEGNYWSEPPSSQLSISDYFYIVANPNVQVAPDNAHFQSRVDGDYPHILIVTEAITSRAGALWSADEVKIDLRKPFYFESYLYQGPNRNQNTADIGDIPGHRAFADGMVFALHNDPRGNAAISGRLGESLGVYATTDAVFTDSIAVNHSLRNAIVLEFDIFANTNPSERGDHGLLSFPHIAWVIPRRMVGLVPGIWTGGGRHHDPGVNREGVQLGNTTHTDTNITINTAIVYSPHLISRQWRPFSFEWQPLPTAERPYGGRLIVETQIINSGGQVVRNLIDEDRGGEGALIYDIPNYRTFFDLSPGQHEVYWGFVGCTGGYYALQAMAFTYIVGLEPTIESSKMVFNDAGVQINGGQVHRGDILTYRIDITNLTEVREHRRDIAYAELQITDVLPDEVSFIPNTVRLVNENGVTISGNATYNAATHTLSATIPKILSNQTIRMSFDVQVKTDVEHGDVIINQATVRGRSLFRGHFFNDKWSYGTTNKLTNTVNIPGSMSLQIPEHFDFGAYPLFEIGMEDLPVLSQTGDVLGVESKGILVGTPWALQVKMISEFTHDTHQSFSIPLIYRRDGRDVELSNGNAVTVYDTTSAVEGFYSIWSTWYVGSGEKIDAGLFLRPKGAAILPGKYAGELEWIFWPGGLPSIK